MSGAFPRDRGDRPARTRASAVAQWIRCEAAQHGFALDAAQERVVRHFERLHDELRRLDRVERSLVGRLARRRAVRGLYVWGGVGRGKSFLMDSFYRCAPGRKKRVHFHRFMQGIHHALHVRQGEADPLAGIARDIAAEARLLCLDEFHVTDITDAMLMRRLLEGLVAEGLVLVTTSNTEPSKLYLHGLQRDQFMPAIDLIERRMEIIHVDAGADYRLRELERAGVYHVDADADRQLARAFAGISADGSDDGEALEVEGRMISVRREAPGVAWFDFDALCEGPRGKPDYIELARRYHTVLVSGVPRFTADDAERLRRFVWLVDEFYDRRVKLIIAAAAPAAELIEEASDHDRFQANLNATLKERLVSRLTEMQTHDYLSEAHLP